MAVSTVLVSAVAARALTATAGAIQLAGGGSKTFVDEACNAQSALLWASGFQCPGSAQPCCICWGIAGLAGMLLLVLPLLFLASLQTSLLPVPASNLAPSVLPGEDQARGSLGIVKPPLPSGIAMKICMHPEIEPGRKLDCTTAMADLNQQNSNSRSADYGTSNCCGLHSDAIQQ